LKRKLALIILLCFSMAFLVTGCGSSTEAPVDADTSWQDIQDKGYFIVGLDDAFPPMGFRDENNEIVGFDIDLAKEAASRMGVEVQFQPVIWDTVTEELNNGNIDLIWNGLTITPEREAEIAFTEPYIDDKQIIVVQKDSVINTKADLADKTVGIQAGSSAVEAVQKDSSTYESFAELVEFGSNDEALLDLNIGRLDAVVVDEVVGRYYLSKKPDDYRVLEEHFGLEDFAVGIRQTDKAFLAELQKTMNDMKTDGSAADISTQWFGENIII